MSRALPCSFTPACDDIIRADKAARVPTRVTALRLGLTPRQIQNRAEKIGARRGGECRQERLFLKLTIPEFDALCTRASAAKLPLAVYCRQILFEGAPL